MKSQTIYCQHCGKLIDAESKFCKYCGSKVECSLSDIESPNKDSLVAMLKNGILSLDKYTAKALKWIGKHWWRVFLFLVSAIIAGFLLYEFYDSNHYRVICFTATIILAPIIFYICWWRTIRYTLIFMGALIVAYGIVIEKEVEDIYDQTTYFDKVRREFYFLTPNFVIPNGVTWIAPYAFSECHSLTSVTIPDSVTSIGWGAFSGCKSLTSVTIPDSVTKIGRDAFSECYSLTSVTIPDSVTEIGEGAFSGCKSLTSVTIPDSVNSIGERAFSGCKSLTSVTIPKNVTWIRDGAFSGCTSLTSVTIPDSVHSIGEYAFWDCRSLTNVYCKAIRPPIGGGYYMFGSFATNFKIYVPRNSVNAYKSAEYWENYASYIVGYDF